MHILNIVLIVLAVIFAILVVLFFVGRKLQTKQIEQKDALDAAKQTVTILVIDKKKMKLKESGLPKIVYEKTPKYLRWTKVPIVKAKVGPKVMSLMADAGVFEQIPLKTEVKATISGIYITEIRAVRGTLPAVAKKKGFFSKLTSKAQKQLDAQEKNLKASKSGKNSGTVKADAKKKKPGK